MWRYMFSIFTLYNEQWTMNKNDCCTQITHTNWWSDDNSNVLHTSKYTSNISESLNKMNNFPLFHTFLNTHLCWAQCLVGFFMNPFRQQGFRIHSKYFIWHWMKVMVSGQRMWCTRGGFRLQWMPNEYYSLWMEFNKNILKENMNGICESGDIFDNTTFQSFIYR